MKVAYIAALAFLAFAPGVCAISLRTDPVLSLAQPHIREAIVPWWEETHKEYFPSVTIALLVLVGGTTLVLTLGLALFFWLSYRGHNEDEHFVDSLHMERYGMLCGWLFFILTGLQLAALMMQHPLIVELNLAANTIYTLTYGSFLVAYAKMEHHPEWGYILGVACYLFGYAVFLTYYVHILAQQEVSNAWYFNGSLAFLLGSVFLVQVTGPRHFKDFSPIDGGAALWWGSFLFLAGSIAFEADSATVGMLYKHGNENKGLFGLVVFLIGRVFFIRGSRTDRCNIFFCATQKHEEDPRDPSHHKHDHTFIRGMRRVVHEEDLKNYHVTTTIKASLSSKGL